MRCESSINPLTREREPRARFCRNAIILRLTASQMFAVRFAVARGYLPNAMRFRYRDDGSGSVRILREHAYAWREEVESDPHAFCACMSRRLSDLFHAADFRIRDSWAV